MSRRRRKRRAASRVHRLPKLCGADVELGNFISGGDGPQETGSLASVAMLREVDGQPKASLSFPSRNSCCGDQSASYANGSCGSHEGHGDHSASYGNGSCGSHEGHGDQSASYANGSCGSHEGHGDHSASYGNGSCGSHEGHGDHSASYGNGSCGSHEDHGAPYGHGSRDVYDDHYHQDGHGYHDKYYSHCGETRRYTESAGRGSDASSRGVLYAAQDWGRRFLPSNGGCIYIDLAHLELAMPEVLSAYDHVAMWHAMLRIAQRAYRAANGRMPQGRRIEAQVNNTDGHVSWGGHLNIAITRRAWDNIFDRRLHYLTFLASFQVSSIVYTGQGKVGSHRDPESGFQLSQRADFFETICAPQTTYRRPIVNSRDEALCGSRAGRAAGGPGGRPEVARLHVIFFDSILAHTACVLRTGVMQIITAMIEAERVNSALILESPLDALRTWSRDCTLSRCARTVSGKRLTAVQLQFLFLEEARRFAREGGLSAVVPRHDEILDLWEEILVKLEQYDLTALSSRLDWALKRTLLERVVDQNRGLGWDAPQLQYLDQLYGSLDPESGLYWSCEASGAVTPLVSDERIRFFETHPPEDTRAWTRAMLLRRGGDAAVRSVNWDHVTLELSSSRGSMRRLRVPLDDPYAATRAHNQEYFDDDLGLEDLARVLGATEELSYSQSGWRRSAGSGSASWRAEACMESARASSRPASSTMGPDGSYAGSPSPYIEPGNSSPGSASPDKGSTDSHSGSVSSDHAHNERQEDQSDVHETTTEQDGRSEQAARDGYSRN